MRLSHYLFMLLLATASLHPLSAQSDPEAVAFEYLQVLSGEGMAATGRYIDPDALQGLKEMFLPILELEDQQSLAQMRTLMFGGTATIDHVRSMNAVDFYTGLMQFIKGQMNQFDMNITKSEVIGAVYEGEHLAHVVVRAGVGVGDQAETGMDVITMSRHSDVWKIGLKSNIETATRQLSAALMRAQERKGTGSP